MVKEKIKYFGFKPDIAIPPGETIKETIDEWINLIIEYIRLYFSESICKKGVVLNREDLDLIINEGEGLIVEFLRKHLNIRSEIRGMDRYDIYEIPIDALREALVNAIVHRDYSLRGTSIYVEIYDDRVVIVNPGGVPSGITKSNFGKESIRRNSIIADLFHRMGKVERIGSGIGKMKSLIESSGLKPPDFELENFFRVTFYRDLKFSLKKVLVEKMGSEIKVGERVGEKLMGNQSKIIEVIKENPHISARELSNIIGISQRKIESNIAKLKIKKLLKRVGPAKGGHWEVIEKWLIPGTKIIYCEN